MSLRRKFRIFENAIFTVLYHVKIWWPSWAVLNLTIRYKMPNSHTWLPAKTRNGPGRSRKLWSKNAHADTLPGGQKLETVQKKQAVMEKYRYRSDHHLKRKIKNIRNLVTYRFAEKTFALLTVIGADLKYFTSTVKLVTRSCWMSPKLFYIGQSCDGRLYFCLCIIFRLNLFDF